MLLITAERHCEFGYELMKRVTRIVIRRLQAQGRVVAMVGDSVLFWSFRSIPARHSLRMSGSLASRIDGLLRKAGWINRVRAERAAGAWCARLTAEISRARVAKSIKAGAVCIGSI